MLCSAVFHIFTIELLQETVAVRDSGYGWRGLSDTSSNTRAETYD